MRYRLIIGLSMFVISFTANETRGNPSSKSPERPITAHGTIEGSKQLVAELYELYNDEEKIVIKYHETMSNPTKWSDRQIAKSAGRLWKARRDVKHLKLMGEPAAHDLENKLLLLAIEVDRFGLAYANTPRGSQLVGRIRGKLNRENAARTRFLEQSNRALQQDRLEVFETQMEKKGVELYEQLVFFSPTARKPFFGTFNTLLDQGDPLLSKQRKAEYLETANAALAEQLNAVNGFAAEAARIAREIASSGNAKLTEERNGNAPESFAYVLTLWQNASANLSRATAIQWAFTNRVRVDVKPSPAQFKKVATTALAAIIKAAATSTPIDNVQATYQDLLKQITIADRRITLDSRDVFQACQPALNQLVAKAPGLSERIRRYNQATSEPLKWRRAFASQQTKHLKDSFPTASSLLQVKEKPAADIYPNFASRFNGEKVVAGTSIFEPANWMVKRASSHLVGKQVSEQTVLRLSPTSKTAVVPFDSQHFANVPADMLIDSEFADLKQALLVDDQYEPLTYESADAISAAEMNDFLAIGGIIEQVHLESVVTRFAALPDLASPLVPLGKSPNLSEGESPRASVCWRLDIQPVWASQRFFTVRRPQK
ncbi:MAG: hypothetical protein P8L85_01305 [Rubripirellula sp.]|nr:hypothetical protein [Rubripirellula sp.]